MSSLLFLHIDKNKGRLYNCNMDYIPRYLEKRVLSSLKTLSSVFIRGPRQVGKTSLAVHFIQKKLKASYRSFDDLTQLSGAKIDPEGFLGKQKLPLILDEIQLVPEIFRVLKGIIDKKRLHRKRKSPKDPGPLFLLTGSADIMSLPRLSHALVGRLGIETLYPFCAREVLGTKGDFISQLFKAHFPGPTTTYSLAEAMEAATFPEIFNQNKTHRSEWFRGYITTVLQRDVRSMPQAEKIELLPLLLRLLAQQTGSLINDAALARGVGTNPVTLTKYRRLLSSLFLHIPVRPWYRNIKKRLVKSPKSYLVDTLLLCYLLDFDVRNQKRPEIYGHIVENFVAMELLKLLSFFPTPINLFHFRTGDGREVDFILEKTDGTLAAIEVKSKGRVDARDFSSLRFLQEALGPDFTCGIILYGGKHVTPFGEKLFAVPLSALW